MAIHKATSILSRRRVTDFIYFKKGTPNVAYLYLCFPYFAIKIIQFGKNKGENTSINDFYSKQRYQTMISLSGIKRP